MGKCINAIKQKAQNKLTNVLKPIIYKQMYCAFKLLNESKEISIEEFIYHYQATLSEIEYGDYDESYYNFIEKIQNLENEVQGK